MSGPHQGRLGLGRPARDDGRPRWFDFATGQENRQSFDDIAELGRHVVRLAGDCGLRIAAQATITAATDCDPFLAWSIYVVPEGGDEDWLGQAAISDAPRERLEAAIIAARNGSARAVA